MAEGSDIPPRLVWSSDCSLHVVFPPGRGRCAPSVAARIASEGLAGVQDVVPASTTAQVVFDPGLASIDEAAARVLAIPLGTVMSRLSRARSRLRDLMEGNAVPAAVERTAPLLRRLK